MKEIYLQYPGLEEVLEASLKVQVDNMVKNSPKMLHALAEQERIRALPNRTVDDLWDFRYWTNYYNHCVESYKEGFTESFVESYTNGKVKIKRDRNRSLVLNLLDFNCSAEEMAKLVNCSLEEVNEILASLPQ